MDPKSFIKIKISKIQRKKTQENYTCSSPNQNDNAKNEIPKSPFPS